MRSVWFCSFGLLVSSSLLSSAAAFADSGGVDIVQGKPFVAIPGDELRSIYQNQSYSSPADFIVELSVKRARELCEASGYVGLYQNPITAEHYSTSQFDAKVAYRGKVAEQTFGRALEYPHLVFTQVICGNKLSRVIKPAEEFRDIFNDPFAWKGYPWPTTDLEWVNDLIGQKRSISVDELINTLKLIPNRPVWARNEKPLVSMRNRLRKFYYNKDWTASDLFEMRVPLNVAVLSKALHLVQGRVEYWQFREILSQTNRILAESEMRDIYSNPNKSYMGNPHSRGVSLQKVRNFITHRVNQLEGVSSRSYWGD